MQGYRVRQDEDGYLPPLKEGEYGQQAGIWYARVPGDLLANLKGHSVTEHEDGSITVTPSILVSGCDEHGDPISWHGYLERGVFRGC